MLTHVCLFYDSMDLSPPGSSCLWNFPGKKTGVGFHFLFQGIFLTEGSNPRLRRWQGYSSALRHLGSSVGAPWFKYEGASSGRFVSSRPCSERTGKAGCNPRPVLLTRPALRHSAMKTAPGGALSMSTDTSFTVRRLKWGNT